MIQNTEKLKKLYSKCIEELKNIGITFENEKIIILISKRNNKRYGCCKPSNPDLNYKQVIHKGWKTYTRYQHYYQYTIEISPWLMELEETIIKNTIIHELIHCLPYCNNHGEQFRYYAKTVNDKLGYHITRTGNKKDDYAKSNLTLEEKEEYRYQIQCERCGKFFYRKRLQKNYTRKYRCSKCLGKLEVMKL